MSTVDTINAAATAIVSAQSRVQPTTVRKRRWGGCWSHYWCFGSHKTSKRIGHAVLVPEPEAQGPLIPSSESQTHSTSVAFPFIAPPSSPASFLQSDPPSGTHTPAKLLSLSSISLNSGPASIFATGPYAHETQLVTPPVFSAFTTEPNTAPFTPPPESAHMTTPSSPEVPFAQLLTSSLERARRNSGSHQKFMIGSPGGQLISPGSVISNSGTSSPFPDRHPVLKRGSRLGSGSVTPDGLGLSRLGSGSVTPDGVSLLRLGSGSATPDCLGPASRDGVLMENQISSVAFRANRVGSSKPDEAVFDHRVSFELSGEEVARCLESKAMTPCRTFSICPQDNMADDEVERLKLLVNNESCFPSNEKFSVEIEENWCRKHRSATLGSIKEFNFDSKEVPEKPTISSEWWANETIAGKEAKHAKNWTFFPLLQPEVS